MTNISIKEISSGEKILIQLKGSFIENFNSPIFKLIVPKFPRLISKADIYYNKADAKGNAVVVENSWQYTQYKVEKLDKKFMKLKFVLDPLQTGKITKGNILKYDATKTTASYIMPDPTATSYTGTGTVLNIQTSISNVATGEKQTIVTLKIPTLPDVGSIPNRADGIAKSQNLGSNNILYRTGVKKNALGARFVIYITDNEIKNNLINTDTVKDLYVYAYVQSDDEITQRSTKKLFEDKTTEIIANQDAPPPYSSLYKTGSLSVFPTIDIALDANASMNKLLFDNGKNIQLYIAIARYTKIDGSWTGKWLQTDENKEVVWGRVPKK